MQALKILFIAISEVTFWHNMNNLFLNIPNVLLWNEINRLKDEQLQAVSTLVDIKSDLIQSNQKATAFNTALTKAHAKHIGLQIDLKSLTNENEKFKKLYLPLYTNFFKNFARLMSLNNGSEEEHANILNG